MNDPVSFTSLVFGASWPVLSIIILLAVVSVVSWTMIFQRYIALSNARRELLDFEDTFWGGTDLRQLYSEIVESESQSGIETIFVSGFREFERIVDDGNVDPEAVLTSVTRVTRVAVSREEESLETHLGFLASVGSVSPYVGLLGTVVGLINVFRDIATMSQASHASLAPGIAEVLIVTAMGLFAAIPAVVAFNRYSARVETLSKRYEGFVDELVSILYRAARAETT
ncbi:MAG: protein TolQ [Gammaproteobacteria bacterium]|nr:protein TolQ [Gammaproteobacteria bacterium]MYD79272.1 protein TolQ [Gammaproteobacteria bacterium]